MNCPNPKCGKPMAHGGAAFSGRRRCRMWSCSYCGKGHLDTKDQVVKVGGRWVSVKAK